jgi:DNA-directed RNA polymerase subunit M/transcription elongation factor TFIIS
MLKEIEKQIAIVKPIRRRKAVEQEKKEEKDEFSEFLKSQFTEKQIKRLEKYSLQDRYEVIGLIFELINESGESINKELVDKALDEIEGIENNYLFNNRIMNKERESLILNLKISRKKIVLKEGSIYKCSKCGSNKIFTTQLQMRRADEPMTTFFQCTSCGYSWRG